MAKTRSTDKNVSVLELGISIIAKDKQQIGGLSLHWNNPYRQVKRYGVTNPNSCEIR